MPWKLGNVFAGIVEDDNDDHTIRMDFFSNERAQERYHPFIKVLVSTNEDEMCISKVPMYVTDERLAQ